ncbi:MAG: GatB/YqeY domain-containing protein [Campylobacterales bacterium]|nr:GatB/YqeY domain-containing protein [Campylobacterales bacterium]
MSALKERLQNDLKEAMKNKENFKRDVIRLMMSALKQVEVDERRELSDDDIQKILQKAVKQREDSFTQYKNASRDDLAQKESDEMEIIKSYLPQQLSDDELEVRVKAIIESVGATTMKDIGKVMGVATKELSGSADGKRVNEMAKKLLS